MMPKLTKPPERPAPTPSEVIDDERDQQDDESIGQPFDGDQEGYDEATEDLYYGE